MMRKGMLLFVVSMLFLTPFDHVVSTASAKSKPVTLKYDLWLPATHWYHTVAEAFITEVEKRSDGRVKFRHYKGGVLGSGKSALERVEKGLTDITAIVPGYTPGRFPLNNIVELPFAFPDLKTAYKVADELVKEVPLIRDEWKKVHYLWVNHTDFQDIVTKGKQVKKPEDMKGLKIRTGGGATSITLKTLGAKPIMMSISDTYMNIQRRIIDGGVFYSASIPGYKLEEVIDYLSLIGLSVTSAHYLMNKATWDSLPKDIQNIIDEVCPKMSDMVCRRYGELLSHGLGACKKAGVKIYKIPENERSTWRKLTKPVWDKWVADMEAKGHKGKEAMAVFEKLLKKHGVSLD